MNEPPDLAVNQANISESGAVNSVVYTVREFMTCNGSTGLPVVITVSFIFAANYIQADT